MSLVGVVISIILDYLLVYRLQACLVSVFKTVLTVRRNNVFVKSCKLERNMHSVSKMLADKIHTLTTFCSSTEKQKMLKGDKGVYRFKTSFFFMYARSVRLLDILQVMYLEKHFQSCFLPYDIIDTNTRTVRTYTAIILRLCSHFSQGKEIERLPTVLSSRKHVGKRWLWTSLCWISDTRWKAGK